MVEAKFENNQSINGKLRQKAVRHLLCQRRENYLLHLPWEDGFEKCVVVAQ